MSGRKVSVVLMPLLIDRLRVFVKNPTLKNWSLVSRLCKYPITFCVRYGLIGYLPILMCSATAGMQNCTLCPLHNTHDTGCRGYCMAYSLFRQNTLAKRLQVAIKLLLVYDSSTDVTTIKSKDLVDSIMIAEERLTTIQAEKREVRRINKLKKLQGERNG